jgi:hypothetical protein
LLIVPDIYQKGVIFAVFLCANIPTVNSILERLESYDGVNKVIFTNAFAQNSKQNTFNLGTPFFVEHYKVIHVQKLADANGTSKREASFIGNGTANDNLKADVSGSATVTPRAGGFSFIQGKTILISLDNTSKADYIFQAIQHSESLGSSKSVGAAVLDSNATGNLSFLNNKLGIYKDQSSENGNGTFAMWEWNNNK